MGLFFGFPAAAVAQIDFVVEDDDDDWEPPKRNKKKNRTKKPKTFDERLAALEPDQPQPDEPEPLPELNEVSDIPDLPGSVETEAGPPELPESLTGDVGGQAEDDEGIFFGATVTSWGNVGFTPAQGAEARPIDGVTRIDGGISTDLNDTFSIRARGRIRLARNVLTEGDSFDTEIEPREVFLTARGERVTLNLGMQTFRWGLSELYQVNDIVNPMDFRDRTGANNDPAHLPILAAHALASFDTVNVEALVVPMFRGHRVAKNGNRWGFFEGRPALLEAARFADTMAPGVLDELDNVFDSGFAPEPSLANVSAGGRLSYRDGGLDSHVNAFYGWERFPVLQPNAALLVIAGAVQDDGVLSDQDRANLQDQVMALRALRESGGSVFTPEHNRTLHIGADAAFTHEKFVLKAEFVGSPQETVYTSGSRRARVPTATWMAGFDYTPIQDLTITAETYGRFLLGSLPPGEIARFGTGDDLIGGAVVRYTPESSKFSVQTVGTYSFQRGDYRIQPRIDYQMFTNMSLGAGATILGGPENSYGGVYNANDHAYLTLSWLAL